MKTQNLLKITVTSELSSAINSMKTKEHEKHARKLAKMVNLCYEEALLKAGSIVIKAEDIKAEGTDLIRPFMETVYDHFLQNSIEAFREEDDALLRASNPSQAHLNSEDLKPTKEYLLMRTKRDSALFILCALLSSVLSSDDLSTFQTHYPNSMVPLVKENGSTDASCSISRSSM